MNTADLTYSEYFAKCVKFKSDLPPGPMLDAFLSHKDFGWFAYDNLPAHPGAPTPTPRVVPLHMTKSIAELSTPARRQKFIDLFGLDKFLELPEAL